MTSSSPDAAERDGFPSGNLPGDRESPAQCCVAHQQLQVVPQQREEITFLLDDGYDVDVEAEADESAHHRERVPSAPSVENRDVHPSIRKLVCRPEGSRLDRRRYRVLGRLRHRIYNVGFLMRVLNAANAYDVVRMVVGGGTRRCAWTIIAAVVAPVLLPLCFGPARPARSAVRHS